MDLLFSNDKAGQYPPSWYRATARPLAPLEKAKGDIKCDVAIIGAGFTGLSTALFLAQYGIKAIILEAQRIGFGASGRNGGQLGTGQRLEQDELEKIVGADHAQALWKLSLDSVDLVKNLIEQYQMPCSIKNGIVHANHRKRFNAHSLRYIDFMLDRYGYDQMEFVPTNDFRDLVDSPRYYGGIIDKGGAHLHPLNFAFGLAQAAIDKGVQIYEQSLVTHINGNIITTNQASINADTIVIATNGYGTHLDNRIARRVMPINNFIAVTEPLEKEHAKSLITNQYAVSDSKFVINYFRMVDENRLLFGGGENYGYRFPNDIASFVQKPLIHIFPQLRGQKIDYAWGGTLSITLQRMPYIRKLEPHIFTACGYSGHGLGLATLCGKLIANSINNNNTDFATMASLPVKPFVGGKWMRTPLLVLAMLYYRMLDKF